MSFRCSFCGVNSERGQAERLVVTEWRRKTYPAQKLPPMPGASGARWTNAGSGHEAAVVKRACPACVVQNAPLPKLESVNAPAVVA